jgi:hypothetical protein
MTSAHTFKEKPMTIKQYTVTMSSTHFVLAESISQAESIVYEALLRLSKVDERVPDSEVDWFHAVTLEDGHYSTIVRDGDEMSDYDRKVQRLKRVRELVEKVCNEEMEKN